MCVVEMRSEERGGGFERTDLPARLKMCQTDALRRENKELPRGSQTHRSDRSKIGKNRCLHTAVAGGHAQIGYPDVKLDLESIGVGFEAIRSGVAKLRAFENLKSPSGHDPDRFGGGVGHDWT